MVAARSVMRLHTWHDECVTQQSSKCVQHPFRAVFLLFVTINITMPIMIVVLCAVAITTLMLTLVAMMSGSTPKDTTRYA